MKNPIKITHQLATPKTKGNTIQKLKYTILEIKFLEMLIILNIFNISLHI